MPGDVLVRHADHAVRVEWLMHAVATWQRFIGSLTVDPPSFVADALDRAVNECPGPETVAESLALRSLLSETLLRLAARVESLPGGLPIVVEARAIWLADDRLADPRPPFGRAARLYIGYFDQTNSPLHERARRWLDAHLDTQAPLAGVAKALAVDQRTIARTFRAAFGLTVKQYQTRAQVERAIHLLQSTDLKVEAVAFSVGCGSKATLYRLLRRATGKRPADLRRLAETATRKSGSDTRS
jgi:AraC-like DNA-binding protein